MLNSSLVFQLNFGVKLNFCALNSPPSPSRETLAATNDKLIIMRTITIIILFLILYSCGIDSNDTSVIYNSADDSLALVKMVNEREIAMKKKDIRTVIAQFSEDATFINGGGYYCANKTEIEAFHKGLTQSYSVGYYYTAGQVHVRILDNKNALGVLP